jgi:hypothetical protein
MQTTNTVARPSEDRQKEEDDPRGRLKKHNNGQTETAGDSFSKVDP